MKETAAILGRGLVKLDQEITQACRRPRSTPSHLPCSFRTACHHVSGLTTVYLTFATDLRHITIPLAYMIHSRISHTRCRMFYYIHTISTKRSEVCAAAGSADPRTRSSTAAAPSAGQKPMPKSKSKDPLMAQLRVTGRLIHSPRTILRVIFSSLQYTSTYSLI